MFMSTELSILLSDYFVMLLLWSGFTFFFLSPLLVSFTAGSMVFMGRILLVRGKLSKPGEILSKNF